VFWKFSQAARIRVNITVVKNTELTCIPFIVHNSEMLYTSASTVGNIHNSKTVTLVNSALYRFGYYNVLVLFRTGHGISCPGDGILNFIWHILLEQFRISPSESLPGKQHCLTTHTPSKE
jgi:hypothetical protein